MSAVRHRGPDGRQHWQHGPIDVVIGADGAPAAVTDAHEAAWARFATVLAELVAELPLLKRELDPYRAPRVPSHAGCGARAFRIAPASSRRWPRSRGRWPTS